MSFLLFTIIGIITGSMFFWIENTRFILLPGIFLTTYGLDLLSQLPIKNINKKISYGNGITLSWILMLIGMFLLGESQGIIRFYSHITLILINTIFLFLSFIYNYSEGENTFFIGLTATQILSILYIIFYQDIVNSSLIISIYSLYNLFIWFNIQRISEKKAILQKEIRSYMSIYSIIIYIFGRSVTSRAIQIWISTLLIATRQQFLSYQKNILQDKEETLTGRALLQGQKILQRYKKKQDKTYSIMNKLLQWGIVPSKKGLQFLQGGHLIQVSGIITFTLRVNKTPEILIQYRLGIICFLIGLFSVDRQNTFFSWYKKFGLIVLNSSLYITLSYQTFSINSIVLLSFLWNCISMFICLFYDSFIPIQKRIFNRSDLLFWLIQTNIGIIITLVLLSMLAYSGDILFALGCIIIGATLFLSYHIRKKYS